jgi:UDP-glucose 4-epimerase
MQRQRVPRIVFSSTAAVYGVPEYVPIGEDDARRPINPYGRSKLAIEWLIADYAAAYGLGYAALRYFNAAGAHPDGAIGEDHDPETHLIPIILQVALEQRPALQIFGNDYPTPDGTCVRDYVHVNDLAQAHLLALKRITPGNGTAYNLGNGKGYSVREVVAACEAVTGRTIPVEYAPRRAGDPPELVASAERATRELGWTPRWPEIQTIVETAWNWMRSHPRGYGDSRKK